MDPSPPTLSEIIKSAPFFKDDTVVMPTIEELKAFILTIDLKAYSQSDIVSALADVLHSRTGVSLEAVDALVKGLQGQIGVEEIKVDVNEAVAAIHDGVKVGEAAVNDIRSAESVLEMAVGVSNVVEAGAETTVVVADKVHDAAESAVKAVDEIEKMSVEAGLDAKEVKKVADNIETVANVVADVAEGVEAAAKTVDQVMDTVQKAVPVVEQHCGLFLNRMSCLKRSKKQ